MDKTWKRGRPGINWTPAMIKELKSLYGEKTQAQLAKHFNCTLSAVKGAVTRYTITRKRIRGWTNKEDKYLLKHWVDTSRDDLAEHFNKTRSAIQRRYVFLKSKDYN